MELPSNARDSLRPEESDCKKNPDAPSRLGGKDTVAFKQVKKRYNGLDPAHNGSQELSRDCFALLSMMHKWLSRYCEDWSRRQHHLISHQAEGHGTVKFAGSTRAKDDCTNDLWFHGRRNEGDVDERLVMAFDQRGDLPIHKAGLYGGANIQYRSPLIRIENR